MPSLKHQLARTLVKLSYKEGSFTLASGRKSDYYFDCRQTALHPEGAWLIGHLFAEMLTDFPDIVGLGGMTLGADPLVTATSVISFEKKRSLYGLLVRKEAKGHGTQNYVEGLGNAKEGDAVAVLEDVITTGSSVIKAIERIELVGLKVPIVCSVLDREEGGTEVLKEAGYNLHSLFTRKSLLEYAKSS